MRRIDFFKSAHNILNKRAIASYQTPKLINGFHYDCVQTFKSYHELIDFHLTKSCTQALEIAIQGLDLPAGAEIILPSYGFVSCANAINNHGYQCVFVDCDIRTMNMEPAALEAAITSRTGAVMTINYGGIACDYDAIRAICDRYRLFLIEDNAHGILAKYNGRFLGTFGDVSTISFDHMKNVTCEEGGGIAINRKDWIPVFQKVLEFGTNRLDFFEGKSEVYEWKSKGSNCFLAESLAKILYEQLQQAPEIIGQLQTIWNRYSELLTPLEQAGKIMLAHPQSGAEGNGHIFWILTNNPGERKALQAFLKSKDIHAASHYAALHLSEYGRKVGVFRGDDTNTIKASSCLLRLPQHQFLSESDQFRVAETIADFYQIPLNIF